MSEQVWVFSSSLDFFETHSIEPFGLNVKKAIPKNGSSLLSLPLAIGRMTMSVYLVWCQNDVSVVSGVV